MSLSFSDYYPFSIVWVSEQYRRYVSSLLDQLGGCNIRRVLLGDAKFQRGDVKKLGSKLREEIVPLYTLWSVIMFFSQTFHQNSHISQVMPLYQLLYKTSCILWRPKEKFLKTNYCETLLRWFFLKPFLSDNTHQSLIG